jgi:hypothetical protein
MFFSTAGAQCAMRKPRLSAVKAWAKNISREIRLLELGQRACL